MSYKRLLLFVFICRVAAPCTTLYAQQPDSAELLRTLAPDSVRDAGAYLRSLRRELKDTSFSENLLRLESMGLRLTELNQVLATSFDTLELSRELPPMEQYMAMMRTQVLDNKQQHNLRYLYMSQVVLNQLSRRLHSWQKKLVDHNTVLRETNRELTQFLIDSTIRQIPSDSLLKHLFLAELSDLGKQVVAARQETQDKLVAMSIWQGRVADDYLEVLKLNDAFQKEIRRRNNALLQTEMGIWGIQDTSSVYSKPYAQLLKKSLQRNLLLLRYYVRSHGARISLLFLTWMGLAFWLVMALRRIRKKHPEAPKVIENAGFTGLFPATASLVAVLAVTPVLFVNPPVVFLQVVWLLQFVLLTTLVMLRTGWSTRLFWLLLLALFVVYSMVNLTIQNNYVERNILLVANLASMVLAGLFLRKPESVPDEYKSFLEPLSWLLLVLQCFALVLLVLGQFTLAKIISVGALFNIVIALELFIAVEFLKSTIYIQVEALESRNENSFAAEFDWEKVRNQFTTTFNWAAVVLWVIALAQNFNVYEYLSNTVRTFLTEERSIGDTTFTFGSVGIFLFIVWLASVISGFITQLFGGFNQQFVGVRKNRFGSAMLLVRLGVITGGFLLAVSASGIPLDKITIVIGALGVGIGFGLQNIVNNLVSGIILAFEKPLQIGDLIEVGTRKGIVREIGFRSSKITTYDGSNVIVPNGDLLSQHLINWTMDGRHQRSELLLGVAYGTDLEKAKNIMLDCCRMEDSILEYPLPFALVHEFADNAVTLRLLFWINDVDKILRIKSSLLQGIYEKFAAAGITIPFPQLDVYVHPANSTPSENP